MSRNDTQEFRREQFKQITEHLMQDDKPSQYMHMLSENQDYSGPPFDMLWILKDTNQSRKYHPEGSVWNHTMLVLDEAAKVKNKSSEPQVFMWAALLHDIGKPATTTSRNGKITSYDHDKVGEKLCTEFLTNFVDEKDFIQKVSSMVRYHMHILYVLKDLPYSDVKNLLQKVDINEIALLGLCDRLGRYGAISALEEADYNLFLNKLKRIKNEFQRKK
jgi:uncharacterized domain HDIG